MMEVFSIGVLGGIFLGATGPGKDPSWIGWCAEAPDVSR